MKDQSSSLQEFSSTTLLNPGCPTDPKSLLEMPFCIKMLSNICVIRTVSAKTCLLDLQGRLGFRDFSHKIFCPGDRDFDVSKQFQRDRPGGMLTAGID